MKRAIASTIIAIAILALCLACAAPNTRGTVETHYDEFRHQTNLVASFDQPPYSVRMLALPDREDGSSMGSLTFGSVSSDWKYLRCRSVDILADENPVALPEFQHEGEVGRAPVVVRERLTGILPRAAFDAMGRASSIRARLCNDVIEFTPDQVAVVRDFVRRWRSMSGGASDGGAPTSTATAPATVPMLPCGIPQGYVRVCLSSRGYRFGVPYGDPCPDGSQASGAVQLTCAAADRPAYHACLSETGAWAPVHAWESCASRGMMNASGDFVPPGRTPEQGVGPDAPPAASLAR
jgi:hypothetical protein